MTAVESARAIERTSPLTASVVVITFNRRHHLERHLPILLADPATTELIVVDDGSVDGTAEFLASLSRQHDRLVVATIPNSGMDAARRAGVALATGEILVLMDDDVEPAAGLIGQHVAEHAQRSGCVVVGYMPVVTDTSNEPCNFATAVYASDYERVMNDYEHDADSILFALWNGHVSMRRYDYIRARAGDATWPRQAFFEDRHLGLQLHRLGLTGRFDRSIRARHHHRGDLRSFRRSARAMGYGAELIHERHTDLLGQIDDDHGLEELTGPARWIVLLGDTPAGPIASWAWFWMAAAGEALRWRRLENVAARFVRRLELRIGARQRRQELRP